MWVLLVNFFNFAMGWILRGAVIKFFFFTAIVLLIAGLVGLVFNLLANVDFAGLSTLVSNLPPGLLWFLHVFQFHIGMPLMLGALLTRFAIRRIPVIG